MELGPFNGIRRRTCLSELYSNFSDYFLRFPFSRFLSTKKPSISKSILDNPMKFSQYFQMCKSCAMTHFYEILTTTSSVSSFYLVTVYVHFVHFLPTFINID